MPRGMQHKCELGLMHFPTVWDHVQRELQKVLQAEQGAGRAAGSSERGPPGSGGNLSQRGTPGGAGAPLTLHSEAPGALNADAEGAAATQEGKSAAWTDSPTWLLLKQLARSGTTFKPAWGSSPVAACRLACWQVGVGYASAPRACAMGARRVRSGAQWARPGCVVRACR